jgi:hypothetical protein
MIRFLNIIVIFCLTIFIAACSKVQYPSSPKKLVILGNSIVRHSPRADVGWLGDWGMAATVPDSDFVHRIINTLKSNNLNYNVSFANIAAFETNFTTYDLTKLDTFRNADIMIVKIAENVVEQQAIDSNFINFYDKLITYLNQKNTHIILSDGFFNINRFGKEDSTINLMINNYALNNRYTFIKTNDLSKDSSNRAYKTYKNAGVQAHPSDKGMRLIFERIWHDLKLIL